MQRPCSELIDSRQFSALMLIQACSVIWLTHAHTVCSIFKQQHDAPLAGRVRIRQADNDVDYYFAPYFCHTSFVSSYFSHPSSPIPSMYPGGLRRLCVWKAWKWVNHQSGNNSEIKIWVPHNSLSFARAAGDGDLIKKTANGMGRVSRDHEPWIQVPLEMNGWKGIEQRFANYLTWWNWISWLDSYRGSRRISKFNLL